ncbi:MAG: hypothetical protein WD793_05470 [Steroidobacteraceae bacterium]
MLQDQPATRKEISRSLQMSEGSVAPALLGLVILLLMLSLAGCSDLPSLVQRDFDPAHVAHAPHSPVSPVTVSTEPSATAPAKPTEKSELRGSGGLVSVDAATGTNRVAMKSSQAMATGDEDQGRVAGEAPVPVSGLVTPFGHAQSESGSRDTQGVGEELDVQMGAGATAHALFAHGSFDEASAKLEAN